MSAPRRRLIIALDQDNFYVAVERILNPALRGKPVGITQKSLLATTSYEARAKGVEKLMSIRRAKEVCPGLILVDGEDLGKYRQYSTAVARLVNGILGAEEGNGRGVEKLGLDEIFFDVTDLVYRHVDEVIGHMRARDISATAHFILPGEHVENNTARGFDYPLLSFPGHVHPPAALGGANFVTEKSGSPEGSLPVVLPTIAFTDNEIARNTELLALSATAHLCNHIRSRISLETGLSSSGGIGHSKMIAKLIGNQHKPDDQTTFIELSDLEGGIPAPMEGGMDRSLMEFLDPLGVRKINGFGHKTVDKIKEALAAEVAKYQAPGGDVPANDEDPKTEEKLTIAELRSKTSLSQLELIFGARLGTRLWQLLHGHDDDLVHPSPDFPKQISVEDSYALDMRRTYDVITRQMLELTVLLLERLEEELVVSHASSEKPSTRRWVRYPSLFRLQIRREWEAPGGRDSKSTALPAFIFDLNKPLMERAEWLHRRVSLGLLRDLLNINKAERNLNWKEYVVYVINVAVTNLQIEPPPPSLVEVWGKVERKSPPHPIKVNNLSDTGMYEANKAEVAWEEDLMEEDVDEEMDNMIVCAICRERVFPFAMVAHARYHGQSG